MKWEVMRIDGDCSLNRPAGVGSRPVVAADILLSLLLTVPHRVQSTCCRLSQVFLFEC